uniref:TLC domain-containing protein n=1 Tax=viral metagenome TaxID=1070528 RepID=A0A6C0H810_9ZZZZ
MNVLVLAAITIFLCLEQYSLYNNITSRRKELTVKQRAYVLSIKAAVSMLLIGLFYNYRWYQAGFDLNLYKNNLTISDHIIQQIAILSFSSYLLMDSIIGHYHYHKYMRVLSGYLHHFVYLCINALALWTGEYPFFLLYMLEELPTVFLSIGSYNQRYRKDYTFGITFLLTRIVFHAFLIYKMYQNGSRLVSGLALLVLTLHVYWLYGWLKKYYWKTTVTTSKQSKTKQH